METVILPAGQATAIPHAADVLRNGGLVAFPTDTVYGLAAVPYERETVERLYVVKGRNHSKAIAILMGSSDDLDQVALNPSGMAWSLARAFWPGPLTLIVPRHPDLPDIISPLPTVGVRVPDHPTALRLLQLAGPLAVTSANISGQKNTTTAQQVLRQLQDRVHLILDGGRTPGGVPSTVVDCTKPEPVILRPGPVSMEALKKALEERLEGG